MSRAQLKTASLQRAIGHEFSDGDLLTLALTHRSAGNRNNERLEFLGDSVVNHIVAEYLFQHFPESSEGEMSRMRAALVRGDTLAEVARELQIGEHLVLGSGERKSGGHRRSSILADALEALAGAILRDSDFDTCRRCVLEWFGPRLAAASAKGRGKDPKTRLQEFLQAQRKPLPEYELLEVAGQDHDQHFLVACRLSRPSLVVEGTGSSRRKAEQDAARAALERLD